MNFVNCLLLIFFLFSNQISGKVNSDYLEENSNINLFDFPTEWNTGMMTNYRVGGLKKSQDFTIKLQPGTYLIELTSMPINGSTGKIGFDLADRYGSCFHAEAAVGMKFTETALLQADNDSYGTFAFHIYKKNMNTNAYFRITVKRIDVTVLMYKLNMLGGGLAPFASHMVNQKVKRKKGRVTIEKTDGRSRVTVRVYKKDSPSGLMTLVETREFPAGTTLRKEVIEFPGALNKYIQVELEKHSPVYKFAYSIQISQHR